MITICETVIYMSMIYIWDGIICINERSWPLVDKLSLGQRRDPEVPLGRILVVYSVCIQDICLI